MRWDGPATFRSADIGYRAARRHGAGCDAAHGVQGDAQGIAISGFGQDEDVRRSEDAGFAVHLTKPLNFDLLKETIQRLVCPV